MTEITITKPRYAAIFAGLGFHNSEAGMYPMMSRRQLDECVCKCYRELSPGFMRCFAGYSDWTREAMDDFAAYYHQMQAWTDTPIYMAAGRGKLHFNEDEMRQYAEDVAERLAYLVNEKKVRHIAYYCFSNELGQVVGGALTKDLPKFKRYHEFLYQAFQNQGLNIGLLATDASMDWSSIDWAMSNMNVITKDYCGHYYERDYELSSLDFYEDWYNRCLEYTDKAARREKHFIVGEFGATKFNARPIGRAAMDVSTYFDSGETVMLGIKLAEMIVGAINAGVFALASWTFMDYPDPINGPTFRDDYSAAWTRCEPFLGGGINIRYNKWGLLRWEDDGDHSPREHYWALGILVKYLKRNAKILDIANDNPLIRVCALMNRDGSVSAALINRSQSEEEISLALPNRPGRDFRIYEHDANNPPYNRFADLQDCSGMLAKDEKRLLLKPESITVVTNDYITKAAPVEAEIVSAEQGRLCWKAVADPNHCYYRVYRDGEQICSTVALSCDMAGEGRYRVLSVDTSGNV